MKKISKYLFIAVLTLSALCVSQSKASACRIICFPDMVTGDCYEFEGDCPADCDCQCLQRYSTIYHPAKDHIVLRRDGSAYVLADSKQTNIGSDIMAEFMASIEAKYPVSKKQDEKTKKEVAAQWASFFKSHRDNKKVSTRRLDILSKETGLKVVKE